MTVTNYQAKLWLALQNRIAKRQLEAKHKAIVTLKSDKKVQRFQAQVLYNDLPDGAMKMTTVKRNATLLEGA